jgi:hypothetical protein
VKVRFQADNDLDQRIVVATLRLDPSIDFQTAPAAGLHRLPDAEVLAFAARAGRAFVSHDRRTMPAHFTRPPHRLDQTPRREGGRAVAPAVGSHLRRRVRQFDLQPAVAGNCFEPRVKTEPRAGQRER